jgi:hypothetical protein
VGRCVHMDMTQQDHHFACSTETLIQVAGTHQSKSNTVEAQLLLLLLISKGRLQCTGHMHLKTTFPNATVNVPLYNQIEVSAMRGDLQLSCRGEHRLLGSLPHLAALALQPPHAFLLPLHEQRVHKHLDSKPTLD